MSDASLPARRPLTARSVSARPLTARSVIASTLLGTDPPRLPVQRLVRVGAMFGISEGAMRTALTRMAQAGEIQGDEGRYGLVGRLAERQARQDLSRQAPVDAWEGGWAMAVVVGDARPASERAELRGAMVRLRRAELREGVWARPDNLSSGHFPAATAVVDSQCQTWRGTPEADPAQLAASLWDLAAWAKQAQDLREEMASLLTAVETGDPAALAPGFVLSADVLRHFQADPLLPGDLLPGTWPGRELRADYDRYDTSYRKLLRHWFEHG